MTASRTRMSILGFGLWLLVWAGLNAAPVGELAQGWGWHQVRAYGPLAAAGITAAVLLGRRTPWTGPSPLALLTLYGVAGLISSAAASLSPLVACSLALSYLSVPLVLALCAPVDHPPGRIEDLVHMTWCALAAIGLAAAVVGLWAGSLRRGWPLYSAIAVIPEVAGMPMVRGTGLARYAGIIILVAAVRLLRGHHAWARLGWGLVLAAYGWLLWSSRSAGATLACGVGLVVIAVLTLRPAAWIVVGAAALGAGVFFHEAVVENLLRGKAVTSISSLLSGRGGTWLAAWELFRDSPLIGLGFHADRFLLEGPFRNHVSNAPLHALVQTGVVGGLPFVAAWCWGWKLVWQRLARERQAGAPEPLTTELAAVFGFMTVRSVFESTGAFYGIDWIVSALVLAYFASRRTPTAAI